jgi:hypothetical protein
MPIIPAVGWLKQEDHEFKPSLGHNSEFQASLDYKNKKGYNCKANE